MIQYPYALYLDSKIIGAARQLVAFFQQGIFDSHQTIIYLKKYKESAKLYSQIFDEEGIVYQFMKPSELDNLEDQVIFYAFNAQSNCRLVANRKLKHIFITHGESNKIASVKPIIRIYDHVVMAGELSIERYYKSGLFDKHDYETGRLIMMGDTFIGRTGFSSDSTKEKVLFYAPTWEGGLETENYSSLQNIKLVHSTILQLSGQLKFKSIIVQAHPNIGHRDEKIKKDLIQLLLLLRKNGFQVYFQANGVQFSWRAKYLLSHSGVIFIRALNDFYAIHALVDISAMESQCVVESIPYNIFYSSRALRNDIPEYYLQLYHDVGISLDEINLSNIRTNYDFSRMKTKLINFSKRHWQNLDFSERIFEVTNKGRY